MGTELDHFQGQKEWMESKGYDTTSIDAIIAEIEAAIKELTGRRLHPCDGNGVTCLEDTLKKLNAKKAEIEEQGGKTKKVDRQIKKTQERLDRAKGSSSS